MKQYLTPEQTAKLIKMGFREPIGSWETSDNVYSIGEVLEMLPTVVESEDSEYATLQIYFDLFNWIIEYTGVEETQYATSAIELLDALYEMLIKLKEEKML